MNVAGGTFDVERIRARFPLLARQVHGKPLIYFDNANTAQKPAAVIEAVDRFYRNSNAIVAAVSHKQFLARPIEQVLAKLAPHGLYVDVKSAADKAALESRGVNVWRL